MVTVEKIDVRRRDAAAVERAAAALREGRVVLLPTETVYGIAGRADAATLERLRTAKGRPAEKPIARLAATIEDVEREAILPQSARRLAERFWPGPLTLVLPRKDGDANVGFRIPGLVFAREAIAKAGVPIAATSANPSGGPEPTSFDDALAAMGDAVDLAFDAGTTHLRAPSSVVRVDLSGSWELLREGFLSRETIARALARSVLFVCTGNTCRSPMAEAILRGKLAKRLGIAPDKLGDAGFVIRSAGTSAGSGGAAAEHAVSVMQERGFDLSQHRSQPLTPELVDDAEVVLALAPSHARAILEWFPEHAAKVRLVDEEGVPDPVGQSLSRYRECADLLERRLAPVIDELLGGSPRP